MDQAVRTGLTVINDTVKVHLLKAIDATKKLRNYGSVFADPVDYIGLGLADYLEVIKRPMDLSTLRWNLASGEYEYLAEFLKDADLIWSNCRVYNGGQSESFFLKAADECERMFQSSLCRIESLGLTPEQQRIIIQNPVPMLNGELGEPVSVMRLHLLSKKLAALPRDAQIASLKWFYEQTGKREDFTAIRDKDIRVIFRQADAMQIRQLDKMVTRKLDETSQMLKVTKV